MSKALGFAAVLIWHPHANLQHGRAAPRKKVCQKFGSSLTWQIDSDSLFHNPIFTRGGSKKSGILLICFQPQSLLGRFQIQNEAICLKCKRALEARMMNLSVQLASLNSQDYELRIRSSIKRAEKVCWSINKSAIHCQIDVKFGTLVSHVGPDGREWSTSAAGQI